jgi:16S rRNA C1402 N4-methylase RsmH
LIQEKQIEAVFIHSNFVQIKEELEKRNIDSLSFIYYDLGISSMQIDE